MISNTDGQVQLPIEIEIYVNSDGSVTFADLEEGAIIIARALTDAPPVCSVSMPVVENAQRIQEPAHKSPGG